MSDSAEVRVFPIAFIIGTLMIAFPAIPVLIQCQFKKMEKKKGTVLCVSHFPAMVKSDSDKKQIVSDATHPLEEKMTVEQNQTVSQPNPSVAGKVKASELMQKSVKPQWVKTKQDIEHVAESQFKMQKTNEERRARNYQIIGDLDDSSHEYSLENTLAMESFEILKGKRGMVLEGEEIDHQIGKVSQQSDSSDYSLFDSQSSRRDIREQRLRLFQLNTSVARRAAAALDDSVFSASTWDKNQKPTAGADAQAILQVEETQDNLIAQT